MRTVSEAMKHRAISWLAELFGGRENSADSENRQRSGKNSQKPRLPTCSVMTFGTSFHTEKSQFVGDNPTRYVLYPVFIFSLFCLTSRETGFEKYIYIYRNTCKVFRDWYTKFWAYKIRIEIIETIFLYYHSFWSMMHNLSRIIISLYI